MTPPRRQRIARSFGSAKGYDAHSGVQRQVARTLAGRLAALSLPPNCRGLEIGCGTGHLSDVLLQTFPSAEFILSDLAPSMVERCRARVGPRATFAALDGEKLPFAPASFDLVTSAMAFQWFEQLPASLGAIARTLKPGGYLAIATVGSDTFFEWRRAHETLHLDSGVLPCPTLAQLRSAFEIGASTGSLLSLAEEHLVVHHPSAQIFLHDLKAIGAGIPDDHHRPLSYTNLKRVMRRLEEQGGGLCEQVSITYHILYAVLRLPAR